MREESNKVSEIASAANMLLHGCTFITVMDPLKDTSGEPDERKPIDGIRLVAKIKVLNEECTLVLSRALLTGSWSCYTMRFPVIVSSTRLIQNGSPKPWQGAQLGTIQTASKMSQKPLSDIASFTGTNRDFMELMHKFIEHVSTNRHRRIVKTEAEATA